MKKNKCETKIRIPRTWKYGICHLGCGNKKIVGAIGVDIVDLPSVDVVFDLNKKDWPFEDNSFDEVHAYHVLEHLNDTINSMSEIWRITKPGGVVYINVPHFSSPNAFVDPSHKSFFALDTLSYFTDKNDLNFYSRARFNISKKLKFENPLGNYIFNLPKLNYFWEKHLSRIIPAKEIKYLFRVIK
jgi:SAM-dependent methyltransferase